MIENVQVAHSNLTPLCVVLEVQAISSNDDLCNIADDLLAFNLFTKLFTIFMLCQAQKKGPGSLSGVHVTMYRGARPHHSAPTRTLGQTIGEGRPLYL